MKNSKFVFSLLALLSLVRVFPAFPQSQSAPIVQEQSPAPSSILPNDSGSVIFNVFYARVNWNFIGYFSRDRTDIMSARSASDFRGKLLLCTSAQYSRTAFEIASPTLA